MPRSFFWHPMYVKLLKSDNFLALKIKASLHFLIIKTNHNFRDCGENIKSLGSTESFFF